MEGDEASELTFCDKFGVDKQIKLINWKKMWKKFRLFEIISDICISYIVCTHQVCYVKNILPNDFVMNELNPSKTLQLTHMVDKWKRIKINFMSLKSAKV